MKTNNESKIFPIRAKDTRKEMIRELVGSYLNLNGRRAGKEPPRNEERLAPIPADIIREGIERLAEEKGTSAEEVVDAAAAEAVGGTSEDRPLEQELVYGDYAEKIRSMYPECKSASSRNL